MEIDINDICIHAGSAIEPVVCWVSMVRRHGTRRTGRGKCLLSRQPSTIAPKKGGRLFRRPKLTLSCSAVGKEGRRFPWSQSVLTVQKQFTVCCCLKTFNTITLRIQKKAKKGSLKIETILSFEKSLNFHLETILSFEKSLNFHQNNFRYIPEDLSIYLWLYSPYGPSPIFSFLIHTQSVGLLGRGISPSQGRYLHTE
jgi:hypothetical protein